MLSQGDRLEVRWVVDDYKDDVHTESVVWWPCTLRAPAKKEGNGGGGDMKKDTDTDAGEEKDRVTAADDNAAPGAWEMHYDANDELGFEAEVRVVRMTGAGTLEDVTCSGEHDEEEDKADQDAGALLLRWRREGCGGGDESPDHSEGDEDEDDADPNTLAVVDVLSVPPDANGNISMQAFADAQRRADSHQISRGGEGLEEAGNRAFAALPMDRQQNIATVFHGFKEGLASALQELVRANGPDYVVTKAGKSERHKHKLLIHQTQNIIEYTCCTVPVRTKQMQTK